MRIALCSVIWLLSRAIWCAGQVVAYTDESAFMNELTAQGLVPVQESFEDDRAWGTVRSTIVGGQHTAPEIPNLGITWSASSSNNEITTGPGPARTGAWGFYSLPHGDYRNNITDGWHGAADQPLAAMGGWVRTNTPLAAVIMFLDGVAQNAIDFSGDNVLDGSYRFFGVISTDGFSSFDYRETEGAIDDQKFIFADDFTFAFAGVVQDCNANGAADPTDINQGLSEDCNLNWVPDECEIDAGSTAAGGPFFCTAKCDPDCNNNGILDACEVLESLTYASGLLSPIGFGEPQAFTISAPPASQADVILTFAAYANLGGAADHVAVDVNGIAAGSVFGTNGSDCPETQPDVASLIVPMALFNSAVGGGDVVITMTPSAEVDPGECDLPTSIEVQAQVFVSSSADLDQDGVPDECQCPADLTQNAQVDAADLAQLLGAWGTAEAVADLNGDGSVDAADLAALLGAWGPCTG